MFLFNQKLLLMTELTVGGVKSSEPHQPSLRGPTLCIVCKLRPVFCVPLRIADTLGSGDLAFKSAPYCVCFNNESQMLQ